MTIDDEFMKLLKFLLSDSDEIVLEEDERDQESKCVALGSCPDCHIALEPCYVADYLCICPKCRRWYNKNCHY